MGRHMHNVDRQRADVMDFNLAICWFPLPGLSAVYSETNQAHK